MLRVDRCCALFGDKVSLGPSCSRHDSVRFYTFHLSSIPTLAVENYSMVSCQRTANKPKRNSTELSSKDLLVSVADHSLNPNNDEALVHCDVD